jgi:hypothetical protein
VPASGNCSVVLALFPSLIFGSKNRSRASFPSVGGGAIHSGG